MLIDTLHTDRAEYLVQLGKLTEAAEQSQANADKAPTDEAAIERAIHYSMIAGDLGAAKTWADRLCKLVPVTKHSEAETINSIRSAFAKNGLHQSVMAQCNQLAYSLAAEHHLIVEHLRSEVDLQDGIVLLTLMLRTSENKAQELDSILGRLLFEQVPDYAPSKYWIGFAAGGNHEHRS